jgi:hypothetical protein
MFGFFLDSINLGFLLRENLLLYSSYLPLGVPNGTVIYINTAATSSGKHRYDEGDRSDKISFIGYSFFLQIVE